MEYLPTIYKPIESVYVAEVFYWWGPFLSPSTRPSLPRQVLRTGAKGRFGLQAGIVYYRSTRYGVRQVVVKGTKEKERDKEKYMNRIVCLAKLSLR